MQVWHGVELNCFDVDTHVHTRENSATMRQNTSVLFLFISLQVRIQVMHIAKKFYAKPELAMKIEVMYIAWL